MAGISPTSRTLKYYRTQGWEIDIVERFNPYAGKFGIRKDLFGIIDLIALAEHSIVGVQSCGQAFAEHKRKLLDSSFSLEWLKSGGRLILIGWRKLKLRRGSKAMRWMPRIYEFQKKDWE